MKSILTISAVAVFFVVAPSPCFALWVTVGVSKERAKELGMEVRSTTDRRNHVSVELEFKTEGTFAEFNPEARSNYRSSVELQVGERDDLTVIAELREDRSKPGRVVVSFTADRGQLNKIKLRVMVPESDGGTAYELRVKDFVELEKDR